MSAPSAPAPLPWTVWLGDWILLFGILTLGRIATQEFIYIQF